MCRRRWVSPAIVLCSAAMEIIFAAHIIAIILIYPSLHSIINSISLTTSSLTNNTHGSHVRLRLPLGCANRIICLGIFFWPKTMNNTFLRIWILSSPLASRLLLWGAWSNPKFFLKDYSLFLSKKIYIYRILGVGDPKMLVLNDPFSYSISRRLMVLLNPTLI